MLKAASRLNVVQVFGMQRRHAGGWFKKNIRVEENAGLRGNIAFCNVYFLLFNYTHEPCLSFCATSFIRLFCVFLEISYKTWEFDASSLARLFGLLVVPSALMYSLMIEENVIKNEAYGREVSYGLVPFPKEE